MPEELSLEEKMLDILVKKNEDTCDVKTAEILFCRLSDNVTIRKSRYETTYKTEAFENDELVYIKWQWVPKPDYHKSGGWEGLVENSYNELNQNNA